MTSSGAHATASDGTSKTGAAGLSIASNSLLILLKVIAGTVTGSVAILTDAIQSSIDLIASVVAYVSVRKADEPADESHRYGHEKIENLGSALEGILVLVGAGVIVFEAVRRLIRGGEVKLVGVGIAVAAVSAVVNLVVALNLRRTAKATQSVALEGDAAHLLSDAGTSVGVLVALVLIEVTGAQWIDSAVALLVAAVSVIAGGRIVTRSGRVLADEALPEDELQAIRDQVLEFGARGVIGYHQLRTRRAGARRYVDLHLQFRAGTSLEDAHKIAHELQDAISRRLGGADVLIHLEPEDRVRPGEEIPGAVPKR
ncbi:MAG: cation diffusion facilitator family transporter [Solirubrobacterales bacterium]|nr:cation diffusion facilitator family transporter [Solirubrobacterales bacterium]